MNDLDAIQAIREAIAHLERSIAPVRARIDAIRRDSQTEIATLEAQIANHHQELARWRAALELAEGRTPNGSAIRRGPLSVDVSDEHLVTTLRTAGRPLTAGQLRAALDLSASIPAPRLTRLFGRAAQRGVIVRTGTGRATRYAAP
ncbi:hypothetical protein [Patulibacter minatonensis]|uniref:hypothetical protein n=1 Tax=Patulibacter minatonensis TaxID=298163 RepID=UPI000479937A|nr:hypothetical protein [Patulibacter minatonensis]